MANTTGSLAMESSISGVTQSATESPMNTSAPTIASASVRALLSVANSSFSGVIPAVLPL